MPFQTTPTGLSLKKTVLSLWSKTKRESISLLGLRWSKNHEPTCCPFTATALANANILKLALQYTHDFDGLVESFAFNQDMGNGGVMHEGASISFEWYLNFNLERLKIFLESAGGIFILFYVGLNLLSEDKKNKWFYSDEKISLGFYWRRRQPKFLFHPGSCASPTWVQTLEVFKFRFGVFKAIFLLIRNAIDG